MDTIISDSRLSTFLKKQIQNQPKKDARLKGLFLCGSQLIPTRSPAVFLLSNQTDSKFIGNMHCHSKWSCPRCTPKMMAQKGTDIAYAIDAMAQWHKKYAFMITFTLPHNKYFSCTDAIQILRETWLKFTKSARTKKQYTLLKNINEDKRAVGKAGEQRTYKLNGQCSAWYNFCEEFDIKAFAKVYELTWSEENGWHPHIHALFWTDKKNFKEILKWEDKLLDKWWQSAKLGALKYWNSKFPDQKEQNTINVQNYYTDWRKTVKSGHKALFISRDRKDPTKADIKKSSYYIVGWSGNSELTGLKFKNAKSKHYTPNRILQTAYENPELREKFIELYLEYAKATHGIKRVQFSIKKFNLNQLINKWKTEKGYKYTFKKKDTKKQEETQPYKVVYWFNPLQWRQIYVSNLMTPNEIITQLLVLAKQPDSKANIDKLLEENYILPTTYKHPNIEEIEQKQISIAKAS